MNAGQKQVRLEGSTRRRLPNAEVVGEVPSVEFRVTVTVRRRNELPSIEAQSKQKPRERTYMTITQGNNGDYNAGAGWDPCTGLGSPNGQNLLKALSS